MPRDIRISGARTPCAGRRSRMETSNSKKRLSTYRRQNVRLSRLTAIGERSGGAWYVKLAPFPLVWGHNIRGTGVPYSYLEVGVSYSVSSIKYVKRNTITNLR